MSRVIFETLSRKQFLRLPETDPPLVYVDGMVVRDVDSPVIYEGLSLEQFLRLPDAKPALEYIDGRVVQKVSPKATHSVLQKSLIYRLEDHARPRRLGSPYPELRCTFGGRSLVPDLAFFARGRLPRDAQGKLVDDVFLAPDLMVEIISQGQTVKALTARATWCVNHGVCLGWVIQPTRSRVHVFRPDEPTAILEVGETLSGHEVLPEFALPLAELFGWLIED
jgi:Uma2 family endonuclease